MAISSVQFKLNGQTYNLTYDVSSGKYKGTITAPATSSYRVNDDHTYHGEVSATNNAGTTSTVGVADFPSLGLRVLEKGKPTISVTYPAASAFIGTNVPTFRWEVQDTDSGINPETVSLSIDSGATIVDGILKTPSENGYVCQYTPLTALDDGEHTVIFNVADYDNNASNAVSVTFSVDTVPPTLNIITPVDGYVTNNARLAVSGTTNDAVSGPVTVQVNDTDVSVAGDGSFSTEVTLVEGQNTITVVATDGAGKSTTVTRTVTLDTSAPVIGSIVLTPNPVDAGATYIITVEVDG